MLNNFAGFRIEIHIYIKINVYSNSEIDFFIYEKKDALFLMLFCL